MSSAKAPLTVSIILPTFNRLDFLRPAIESVFAQTFIDWDLIIADDGSDETTRAYLRTLTSEPRVQILWLPHTGNPGAVRNAACSEAKGEYIAFLDSDDLWRPTKLERQIASLRSSADCRWSYTSYDRIGETGELIYPEAKPMVPHRGAIFESLLTLEAEVSTPAVVVERNLLALVGGFDEEQFLWEDYDLWLRLALHSEVDLVDEPLTRLRSHELHYSSSGTRNLEDRLKLLKKMQPLAPDAHLRSVMDHLIAQRTLNLARIYANSDRPAAAMILADGCLHSWRILHWWTGMPVVLLKLLTPRVLINFYRRARAAGSRVRTPKARVVSP
jgi:glycosyltransferase involved in cell wall biosynthesis